MEAMHRASLLHSHPRRVLLNKAPWMVEQDPQWLGMGIYW